MKEKEFTARELVDELRSIDESMYEKVLYTISDHYNHHLVYGRGYYAWNEGKNGNMLMYIEGE